MMSGISSAVRICYAQEPDRITLEPLARPGAFRIADAGTGETLGTFRHVADCPYELELFHGKGGFMAVVYGENGLRYFALPGSSIQLPGLELELPGERLASTSPMPAQTPAAGAPQTVTNQATILGAGLATRFERVSGEASNCSKPGVPLVGNATVIECIANGLSRHGFTRLIVNTFFKPESVKDSLSRSAAGKVLYIDEEEPSGTAGGLRKMLLDPRYAGLLDETKPLLVVLGDAVTDADFSALMEAHGRHRALLTIGCQVVSEDDVEKFGIIVTDRSGEDGQSGRITAFQEKPGRDQALSRLANTGFYVLSPEVYPLIREIYLAQLAVARSDAARQGKPQPAEVSFDFALDIFPAILARTQADSSPGPFRAESVGGYWRDIGNPRQYIETVHDIYAGKVALPLPEAPETYYREGIIYWEGCQALADREGARLSGNIVVGKDYKA